MRDYNKELYSNKSNTIIQNYAWALKEKQLKIMELLCSCYMTNYYDAEKNTITVGLADFMRELGYTTANQGGWAYNDFRKIIKELSDTSIIGIGFNGNERLIRLMNTFEYLKDTSQIKCFMSEDFKECMKLQDKGNTKIEFKTICSMNSRFSIKLYNLLRSWQGREEVYFDVDYLKELLHITAKSYDNFAKFRQAALDVAVDEINEKTNLKVSYKGLITTRGRSRKTTRVVFNIQKNEPKKTLPSSVAKSESPDQTSEDEFIEDYTINPLEKTFKDEAAKSEYIENYIATVFEHERNKELIEFIPEEVHGYKEHRIVAIRGIVVLYLPPHTISPIEKEMWIMKTLRRYAVRVWSEKKDNVKYKAYGYYLDDIERWLENNYSDE